MLNSMQSSQDSNSLCLKSTLKKIHLWKSAGGAFFVCAKWDTIHESGLDLTCRAKYNKYNPKPPNKQLDLKETFEIREA